MHKNRRKIKSQAYFHEINRSPTNRSSSKQTHSFGKSSRFPKLKPICPIVSYQGQKIKTKRAASIGIGVKSDFTKISSCSPPCSKYQIQSNFQSNYHKNKGCTFGRNRDSVKFGSYVNHQLAKLPPSNRYYVKNKISKNIAPLFSLGSRTKILNKSLTIQSLNQNPGPGTYHKPELIKRSASFISGYVDLSFDFSASKSIRFPSAQNRIPGPGSYQQVLRISQSGNVPVSQYKGRTNSKISVVGRFTKFDQAAKKSLQTPGAGTYRVPSQFGYHDEPPLLQKFKKLSVNSSIGPRVKN